MQLKTRFAQTCLCCSTPLLAASSSHRASPQGGRGRRTAVERSRASQVPHTPLAGIIDVHHHIIPPFYLETYRDRIAGSRGGEISAAWQSWSPESAIAAMDACNVRTAMLSLSTPGVWFGDAREACEIARRANDYAADLRAYHPGRFGVLAALPLPDIEGSLRELDYALDTLKADGLCLLTSYGDNWLGDPRYVPVFDEIDRRGATVFVHPTTPTSCRSLLPGVPPLIAEVPQDTTRAIMSLLFSGAFSRWSRIRFIFSHAGGTLPMVANRLSQYQPAGTAAVLPHGIDYELRRLFYDLAGTAYEPAVAALMALVPPSQIVFGSDNPYIPLAETAAGLARLAIPPDVKQMIAHENASKLFPHLAKAN